MCKTIYKWLGIEYHIVEKKTCQMLLTFKAIDSKAFFTVEVWQGVRATFNNCKEKTRKKKSLQNAS